MKSSIVDTLAASFLTRPSARQAHPATVALRVIALALIAAFGLGALLAHRADAAANPTLYSFGSSSAGTNDGQNPEAPPVEDANGNLWGTTYNGGTFGLGTVWELVKQSQTAGTAPPPATKEVVYSFGGPANDGNNPVGGLVLNPVDHLLYGATSNGGANGYGAFFQVNPTTGAEQTVYSLTTAAAEPNNPSGTPVTDGSGNFYFPCFDGGTYGAGGIIKVSGSGSTYSQAASYSFGKYLTASAATSDGAYPFGPVCIGRDGNIYGTTSDSFYGAYNGVTEYGTVFKFNSSLTNTVTPTIYLMLGGNKGAYTTSGLIQGVGADTNLYGTCITGGAAGYGDVFSVSTTGTFTELYAFPSAPSATSPAYPQGTLTISTDGTTLFGTTTSGGGSGYAKSGTNYYGGNVFQLVISSKTYTNLWGFTGNTGGTSTDSLDFFNTKDVTYYLNNFGYGLFYPEINPFTDSGLSLAPDGYIYGTGLFSGTKDYGTVYRVGPPQTYNYTFFVTGASASLSVVIDDYMAAVADNYTINSPAHGTLTTPLTGSFTAAPTMLTRTYTPTGGYVGVDGFTYTGTNTADAHLGTSLTGALAYGNVTIYDGTITASASPASVTGTTTALTAAGTLPTSSDTTLTYTWGTSGAPPAAVTFSGTTNGTNAAKSGVTATFTKAGSYTMLLTVTAPDGTLYTTTTPVTVTATAQPFTLTYSPNPVGTGGTSSPTATAKDQFGNAIAPTYTVVNSGGAASTIVAATGVLTAGASTGTATVTATAGTQTATATVTITTPQIVLATAATANNVSPTLPASGTFTGSSVTLKATGTYSGTGGNTAIIYTWTNTGPTGVAYSPNGTDAASTSTATFTQAGTYVFTVTMTAPTGTPVTSQVTVVVTAAAASIVITPTGTVGTPINMENGTQLQFTATVKDQFGNTIASPSITWGYEYAGSTITTGGLFTEGSGAGPDYVKATSNGITAYSYITVQDDAAVFTTAATATPNPVTGTTTVLSCVASYPTYSPALQATPSANSFLTYQWTEQSGPAAVTVNPATGAASTVTVTFTKAGVYKFYVVVTTADGLTTQSPSSGYLTVTVNQTATTLTINPSPASVNPSSMVTLAATLIDQFGATITATPVWSLVSGGTYGSINSASGVFTATATQGTAVVQVAEGGLTKQANVNVTATPPVFTQVAEAAGYPNQYAAVGYGTGTVTDTYPDTKAYLYATATYGGTETYQWSYTGPSGVTFDSTYNATTYDPTVTFTQAGTYVFTCKVTGADGLSVTSSVTFILQQVATSITVTPAAPTQASAITIFIGNSLQYTAVEYDQFGIAMATQPTFTWSAVGGINSAGLYTAAYLNGLGYDRVTAAANGVTSAVSWNDTVNTPALAAAATYATAPSAITTTGTTLQATPTWGGPLGGLTYTWSETSGPGAVTPVGTNGTNAAQNLAITFPSAGTYVFKVTITTPPYAHSNIYNTLVSSDTATATVTITVTAVATSISVTAVPTSIPIGASTSALTASVKDQFGNALGGQTFAWSITSGAGFGTLNTAASSGANTFNPTNPGTATVKATDGALSGTVTITVTDVAPTLTAITVNPNPVTGTTAVLSVTGNYGGSGPLTYTWSTTGTPPASVAFSGGTSGNPGSTVMSTATFTKAGSYTVQVAVQSPSGLTSTASVTFTVNATYSSVKCTPNPVSVAVGGSQQFTAVASDQFGNALATQPTFTWSVTNNGSAASSINATGLLSAGGVPGTAVVKAASGAFNDTSSVAITDLPPSLATLNVTPNPVTGTTAAASVTGTYTGFGNITYVWSATGPASVSFSPATSSSASGIMANTTATFTAAGTYTIQVTGTDASGGSATLTKSVTVNQTLTAVVVTPPTATLALNGTQTFTASAKDQFGTAITGQTFTWSKSGVGSINAASGAYAAGSTAGTATVTATDGSVSGTATVTVNDSLPTVATAASATPNPVTGTTTSLSVLGSYAGGEGSLTYTWSATGPATVTYSINGTNASKNTTATFTKAGTYTLTATISNPSAQTVTSQVTVVVNQTPAAVTVTPATKTLAINGMQTFTATATDQFGNAITGQTFTWSSTGVGSIDGTGNYSAGTTPGTATVKAVAGTVSGTASVTVTDTAPTLGAITVSPNPVTGVTGQFAVTGNYGGTGNLTYTWSSTAGPASVAFSGGTSGAPGSAVTTTATFTKAGTYTVQVVATDTSGTTSTATVTFTVNATYTSVNVTPNPVSVPVGGSQQFTAVAYDQFGNALATQPSFTWSIADSGGAVSTVSASGLLTAAGSPGTAVVTASATVSSVTYTSTATATITDVTPTLSAITSNHNPLTGTACTFTVTGTYAGGGTLTYAWSATGPSNVVFSGGTSGASGSAVTTTATFNAIGTYTIKVIVSDAAGLTATQTYTETVSPTESKILTNLPLSVAINGTVTATATAYDQFGVALATQPSFAWSVTAGGTSGSINAGSGVFTATGTPGTATISVTGSTVTTTGTITVINQPPTVATAASANPNPVTTGKTTNLTVLGAYTGSGGEGALTYTWSAVAGPASPSFSVNGSNAAKTTVCTFAKAGTYDLRVTITDAAGGTTSSDVTVTVNQTLTTITVTPGPTDTETIGTGTQTYTATGYGQFGNPMAVPPTFTWSNTGVGSVNSSTGVYTITVPGTATITASAPNGFGTTITGSTAVTVNDVAPTVGTAASATPSPVTGTTTNLSVLGQYTNGESGLTYTWASSPSTGVSFSANGTNASKNTTATFSAAGSYTFTVTIADAYGSSVTSTVSVLVYATKTSITVTPNPASVAITGTQQFSATLYDQFGNPITGQTLTWSVKNGYGTITAGGLYTAGTVPNQETVEAAIAGATGDATVNVTDVTPTVATAASASPSPVTGTTTSLSVLGAYAGGESGLTYTWASSPSTGVTFSANGTNAAKNTTATFTQAGTYTFTVTIADAYGATVTSMVTVVVKQTLTTATVTPSSASLSIGGAQTFTASVVDQFGNPVTGQTFTWSVSGVGTINASTGAYSAGFTPGTATVTAATGGVSATVSVLVTDSVPTVATAASASPNPVAAKTTALSVLGSYTGGESTLTYTWASSPGTGVSFSANGTNAAKNTTATFTHAGTYTFTVTIADTFGGSTTSTVTVVVNQTLTAITVTPNPDSEQIGTGTQQFTALATDQFGDALSTQPTFTWSDSGVGSVNASGLFTIGTTPGTATLKAANGSLSGTATVTVSNVPPTVATAASATPSPVTGTTTNLSVLGQYTGGESTLTYTWASSPSTGVSFSANGTNAAKNTTATFTQAGTYTFTVTIADTFGGTVTSTVQVVVNQAPTVLTVTPNTASVNINGTQTFTGSATDQFGTAITGATFTWSVKNGVGTITAGGVYTAGTVPGPETVEAAYGGLTGDATVTVSDVSPALGSITVTPSPVTGTTATCSVTGTYAGSGSLAYSWSATGPAPVNFSGGTSGASGSAVTSTATFGAAGTYTITVKVSDIYGATATKTTTVTVNQTITAVAISPVSANVTINGTQTFTGSATDQFGAPMSPQPTFTYSVTGGGTINAGTGVYTAPNTPGSTPTVTASIASPALSATATVTILDANPTVATAASATPNPVTGTTTALSVLGAYTGGASSLTYTWSVQSGPLTVAFSANGTNASKNTTATFNQAGTYVLSVVIGDPYGGSAGSQVTVTVNQTPATLTITPSPASVTIGGTQQLVAAQTDQFGDPLASQPTFTWSVTSGGGTVSATGLYTAPLTPGTATVKAVSSSGGSASVTVTVTDATPTVATAASATPSPVTGTTTALSVLGAYVGGESNLTYTWAETGGPTGVTFSVNGSNLAKNTVATFPQAGSYTFTVTIADPSGASVTSSVSVTVNQTLTTLSISPNSPSVSIGGTQQFTTTTLDQFGNAMSPSPTVTWNVVVGSGTITAGGLYTATYVPGTSTVKATSGSVSDTTSITITDTPVTVATAASANPSTVTAKTTTLSVLGAWAGGEGNLSYSWTATGPSSVGFAPNGSNAAKNATATFTKAGSYTITCTITDGYGGSATSSVTVTVQSTQTALSISPTSATINVGGTKQFTATATDQFGNALTPSLTWTITSGPGSVSSSGLYTASATAGTATVQVSGGGQTASATVTVNDVAPTVATAASATPNPVTAKTTTLSVLGAYAGGESNLTYTWSLTSGPTAVTYSANGTNAAKSTTATFTQAGSYQFLVTIATPSGLTVTSSVTVTVNQTPTTFTVSPTSATVVVNGSQQLVAQLSDQFGNPVTPAPTITWSITSGGGTVNSNGQFIAPNSAGTTVVKATTGSFSASSTLTIIDGPPSIAVSASATPNPVTGTTTALSVLGSYIGGESTLTYTWSATGPAAVTYSINGTNAAKNTTATFTKAGTYTFTVTITTPSGLSTTNTVTVTVNQTPTSVTVTPNPGSVAATLTLQMTATSVDQFGTAISPSPTFTWSVASGGGTISSSGLYTAPNTVGTATVKATAGSASGTATINITAAGTLNGTVSTSSAAVNLTTQGTLDWDHWGRGVPGLDQKSGGNLITGYTAVGTGTLGAYRTDSRPLSWTNGTPTASSTNNITGVYSAGQGSGFQIKSPAIGTTRTLVVYVGGNGAGGTLTATMSDGSTGTYTSSLPSQAGVWDAEYTFVYAAGTSGATLNVTWVQSTSGNGSVTLSAATLH